MYAEGKGVSADNATAVKWLTLASNEDKHGKGEEDADAHSLLHVIYQDGIGGAQNWLKQGDKSSSWRTIFDENAEYVKERNYPKIYSNFYSKDSKMNKSLNQWMRETHAPSPFMSIVFVIYMK